MDRKTIDNLEKNTTFLINENRGLREESLTYKQALNIIFGKNVHIDDLKRVDTVRRYNLLIFNREGHTCDLTQQEFDLLQSVMRCLNI